MRIKNKLYGETITPPAGLLRMALCMILASTSMTAFSQSESNGLDTIINMIEKQEGQRDPKCHATATRLEGFIYGTPLGEATRHEKVRLHKELVLSLWQQVSKEAAKNGQTIISGDAVAKHVKKVLPYDKKENGDVEIKTEKDKLVLEERDVRQYSSVAYALRAVLSVQQDALLAINSNLVTLSPEAIAEFRDILDVYTLATLMLADQESRIKNNREIQPETFRKNWEKIALQKPVAEDLKLSVPKDTVANAEKQPLIKKIIHQKIESYKSYNNISDQLFWANAKSFFTRHDWPSEEDEIRAVTQTFTNIAMTFAADFMLKAEQKALKQGDALIRGEHVEEVFHEVAPFEVNSYEDVTYFFNMPREKQLTLEAYDCDSFRDSGLHWKLISQVIHSPNFPLKLDFDPFGSEMLAEGTAQIGVLLFRVAGMIAKEQNAPVLTAAHLEAAGTRIIERLKEHFETTPETVKSEELTSAKNKTSIKDGGTFFSTVEKPEGLEYEHRSSDWLNRFQRSFLYSIGSKDNPPQNQKASLNYAPSFSGSGIATEDINDDGNPDVLLVGGAGNKLFLSNGDGSFKDVTSQAGIDYIGADGFPGEPRQPIIADMDNDGLQDILITYVNDVHRIYKNMGHGKKFKDVTDTANFGGKGLVGSAATVFDYDRDGLLDVYICYYGNYLEGIGPNLSRKNTNATPNKLFRNMGGFKFKDVSKGSGIENTGWSQAVSHTDLDNDGWQDLIVGNDFGVNSYYRNMGDGTFKDMATEYGADLPCSAMNVGITDLNNDNYPDVYISNILTMVKDEKYVLPSPETPMRFNPKKMATMRVVAANHLFTSVASGDKLKRYVLSDAIDRGETDTGWAWDADFFDFDNDGDDDLYCVNGLNEYRMFSTQYETYGSQGQKQTLLFSVNQRERNVFFVNQEGSLQNLSKTSGTDFLGNSRAAAYLDFDNDGDLDIIVNNYHTPITVLANNSDKLGNHWLKIKLVGNPKKASNRDAIGARIIATTEKGGKIWRTVQGGTGYLSLHPKEQHFGLGDAKWADVKIVWPNGDEQQVKKLASNKVHTIEQ